MGKSGKRIKQKRILILLSTLVLGFLSVNWFLTYRLEDYLNRRLSRSIYEATDGFYSFSFERLSLDFFTGELTVEKVRLKPDSTNLALYQRNDSLPTIYFDVLIDKIDLQGVNLTWRVDYKELDFYLFELQSPEFKIYRSKELNKEKKSIVKISDEEAFKTIHEMISPYFDLISSRDIKLLDANISYTVLDDMAPSIYALENVNLYAHGFRLDKDSYARGDLLFCENLDFEVDHSQTILSNNQLILHTDGIRLSTTDSIIQLKGVDLKSRQALWADSTHIPDEYIRARLNTVELKGIELSSDYGRNFLNAREFLIDSSAIEYYKIKQKQNKDSEIGELSLYKAISPIFVAVNIQNIKFNRTKMRFVEKLDNHEDVYLLNRVDAYAEGFSLDSLSEDKANRKLWYSEYFGIKAQDISAKVLSKNHQLFVEEIDLDTKKKYMKLKKASISPCATSSTSDYLLGSLARLELSNLELDYGIDIGDLWIEQPILRYTRLAEEFTRSKPKGTKAKKKPGSDVMNLLKPIMGHLYINKLRLSDADLEMSDEERENIYSIQNLDLTVDKILMNEYTRKTSPYLFSYNDFDLSFTNFNNYLPQLDYRLQIGEGHISQSKGNIRLKDMKLTPYERVKQKRGLSYTAESPLLELKGLRIDKLTKQLCADLLSLTSPRLSIYENTKGISSKQGQIEELQSTFIIESLVLGSLLSNKLSINYTSDVDTKNYFLSTDSVYVDSIEASEEKGISLNKLYLGASAGKMDDGLEFNFEKLNLNKFTSNLSAKTAHLEEFSLSSSSISYQNNDSLGIEANELRLEKLDWVGKEADRKLSLGNFSFVDPVISYSANEPRRQLKDNKTSTGNLYKTIREYLDIVEFSDFGITNSTIHYAMKDSLGESINTLNLSPVNFRLENFNLNSQKQTFSAAEIALNTQNISFPISNGFYIIDIGDFDFSKRKNEVRIANVSMSSPYAKYDYAYKHPTNADWFNLKLGSLSLSEINFDALVKDTLLDAQYLQLNDVLLENLKNQQIEIEHNIMPMIYNEIHRLPFVFNVERTHINNFEVRYEELPKNGMETALIRISEMNGKIKGLTNRAKQKNQQIELLADGKFMGTGCFTAQWMMPVSMDYDFFTLRAHMRDFNLKDLNPLLMPMAPAEIKSGLAPEFHFYTEATSKGAIVDMKFLYNDFDIVIYSGEDRRSEQRLYTHVANRLIQANNPSKLGRRARQPRVELVRNPYHSTFNYFWQILQPPLVESIGISKTKQNYLANAAKSLVDMAKFFGLVKDKNETEREVEKTED